MKKLNPEKKEGKGGLSKWNQAEKVREERIEKKRRRNAVNQTPETTRTKIQKSGFTPR